MFFRDSEQTQLKYIWSYIKKQKFVAINPCLTTHSNLFCFFKGHIDFSKGNFLDFSFYVRYSTLLHVPPLRFHRVGGCWDRTHCFLNPSNYFPPIKHSCLLSFSISEPILIRPNHQGRKRPIHSSPKNLI
jgi:hypothetical protein